MSQKLQNQYIPDRADKTYSVKQAFQKAVECVSRHGLEYVAYGAIIKALSGPREVMLNNYPPGWNEYYMDSRYKDCDPVIEHALTSNNHSVWTPSMFGKNIKTRMLLGDINDIGLVTGITIPVRDQQGNTASVNFVGRSVEPGSFWTDMRVGYLYLIAHSLHEAIVTSYFKVNVHERGASLTTKEIDIVRWIAEGKTSSEVAQICKIKDRTVEFHLKNIRDKFGATNTTHAIFKAAQMNFL